MRQVNRDEKREDGPQGYVFAARKITVHKNKPVSENTSTSDSISTAIAASSPATAATTAQMISERLLLRPAAIAARLRFAVGRRPALGLLCTTRFSLPKGPAATIPYRVLPRTRS